MIRKNPRGDLPQIHASEFAEDVVRTNNELVRGYKHMQNEF